MIKLEGNSIAGIACLSNRYFCVSPAHINEKNPAFNHLNYVSFESEIQTWFNTLELICQSQSICVTLPLVASIKSWIHHWEWECDHFT